MLNATRSLARVSYQGFGVAVRNYSGAFVLQPATGVMGDGQSSSPYLQRPSGSPLLHFRSQGSI
eukprot:6023486-Amphidinium_carterae.1